MQIEFPNAQIKLPNELQNKLKTEIVSVVLDAAKQASGIYYDLPPYANKSQLRSALKVGNERVEEWISEGLPVTKFSQYDYRFDRNDVIKFFNERKI